MFELFIALFGGLFYALKIRRDKAGTKEYSKRATAKSTLHKARWEQWQSAVADAALENEIKRSIPNLQKKDRRVDMQLAKLGKVRSDARCYQSTVDSLALGTTEQSKIRWEETLRFWVSIRDELVARGVKARLIFVCGSANDWEAQVYDADDVEQFRYKSGTLHWLPNTYFNDDLSF